MKKRITLFFAVMVLAGCSVLNSHSLYEVRLTSGERLYADSKPELKDDSYEFHDVNDQKYIINRASVLYIEPSEFSR
ncbi:YgdI/YgdR family lipoprotein [Cardiobacteriaceae bacterium TAE3-ERU3]|nr:YgdI/YgdR family lipoprotein [Cardiobacteriaceae bacterium TAE3-ERU3]